MSFPDAVAAAVLDAFRMLARALLEIHPPETLAAILSDEAARRAELAADAAQVAKFGPRG